VVFTPAATRQGVKPVKPAIRLAIIVSHPIQYYAPLYRRLAQRTDVAIKVFFTWHAGQAPVMDQGFKRAIAWDIPLTEGYDFELVPNVSSDPGMHHFLGLRNPTLAARVTAWNPDLVHVTGWTPVSNLLALRYFHKEGIPTIFRGDSHLLDEGPHGLRWLIKKAFLEHVFSWPSGFLVVGAANRAYYEAFGVGPDRLFPCPHSIDVARFAEPAERYEGEASRWRRELGLPDDRCVAVFAGKFERKKRPLELMRAVQSLRDPAVTLVMVGNGELEADVKAVAEADPVCFRVLPFQNQSRMPVVYRLGDLFVLPSAFGETWGLAVNEALACGRPVLVSDRVGCAPDVVDRSCGRVFSWGDADGLTDALTEMTRDRSRLVEMSLAAASRAWSFDVAQSETALVSCVLRVYSAGIDD
jgi:glycosyltransferase involved in cell wall biosynthesis